MVVRRMEYLISNQENDFPLIQALITNLHLKPLKPLKPSIICYKHTFSRKLGMSFMLTLRASFSKIQARCDS